MTIKLGYLLPTRERIMEGKPETGPMLDLATQARDLATTRSGSATACSPAPAMTR